MEYYNKTILGWIPEEWQIDYLENLAKRSSGHTPNKDFPEYYNGGIKWISLADSYRLDNGLISETEIEISENGLDNSSAVLLPAGTVVLSRDAGVGKSAVMAEPMAVSQHFIAWTCNSKLDNWFLYYYLQYKKVYFEKQAVGSTIKTIGLPFFKKLLIINPPFPEQRKIAAILSAWDKAIEKGQQLRAALQKRHQALAQRLLQGRQRLIGFKEQWQDVQVGNFLAESRIAVINPDVDRRITVRLNMRGIEKREVRGTEIEEATVFYQRKAGQFIYGKQNLHKGAFGILPAELDGFESSQDIPAFDISNAIDPRFLIFYLSQQSVYTALENISTGTGSKRIQPKELFKVVFPWPGKKEQTAIADVLGASEREIAIHHARLTALQTQKCGLMQQLLTGKTRVKL